MSRRQKITAVVLFAVFIGVVTSFVIFKVYQDQLRQAAEEAEREREIVEGDAEKKLIEDTLSSLRSKYDDLEGATPEEEIAQIKSEVEDQLPEREPYSNPSGESWGFVNQESEGNLEEARTGLDGLKEGSEESES